MEDHRWGMLELLLFRRWHSSFIVNYDFSRRKRVNEKTKPEDVEFRPADFFSREIQGNVDVNGSMVWHFPIDDTENEWLCIRIPCE
jgi:hypothetical protein